MTVLPLDREAHDAVQMLLPWYLTRRLEPQEQALVERHLAVCAHCRAELAFERRLKAALAELPAGDQAEQGLARLRPQLRGRRAGWWRWRRALAAALLLGGPAALLGLWPAYRGLGPASAGPANLVLKPRAGSDAAALRQRLPEGVTVVGSTVTGGWLLWAAPPRRAEVLARLRADPAVELAEPLDAGPPP